MCKDYFKILGIKKGAGRDEIKKAYKNLALKYHPDKNKLPGSEAKFKEIAAAYQALTDITKEEITENIATSTNHQFNTKPSTSNQSKPHPTSSSNSQSRYQTSYKKYDRETGSYQQFHPKAESSYRQHSQHRPFNKPDQQSTSNGHSNQQNSTTFGHSEPQFKSYEDFIRHQRNKYHPYGPPQSDFTRLYSVYYNAYVHLFNLYNQYQHLSGNHQSHSNQSMPNINSNGSSNKPLFTLFNESKVSC